MHTTTTNRFAPLLLGMLLALPACGGADEAPPDDSMPMEGMDMEAMGMEGMDMDPAMMERHADEAEEMAGELTDHIAEFRALPPEGQHTRMADHVRLVSRMLSLMDRQMREMSMGMPMSDEQMGGMMGMSGEQHQRMLEEMGALREETERLQIGSVEDVRSGMPAHLDRLEAMVGMLERSAEHMRGG